MFKMPTPICWANVFPHVRLLIIDDNGYIYSEVEYAKPIKNPIGLFDYDTNRIYGPDYDEMFGVNAIGKIRYEGNQIVIYGPDYHSRHAKPIYMVIDDAAQRNISFFQWFITRWQELKTQYRAKKKGQKMYE